MRTAALTPDQLDAERRAVYDAITAGPRASGPFRLVEDDGSLIGPFGPMLLAPAVGGALAALGEAIRYRSSLSARTREIAILAVAAMRRNEFEWWAHERVGRAIGMTDDEMAAIKAGGEPEFAAAELDVLRYTRAIAEGRPVDDAGYRRLVEALGEPGVAELATLVGYYTTLAMVMEVFQVSVPRGEPRAF